MNSMVLLRGDAKSAQKVTVLCPVCKRISKRTLYSTYVHNRILELKRKQKCPVCGNAFDSCDPSSRKQYANEYKKYLSDPAGYNASVAKSYERKQKREARTPKHLSSIPTTVSSAPKPEPDMSSMADDPVCKRLDQYIDHWKRELLDTTKRSRMLNFKETKRATLKILEPDAATLFKKLATGTKPLTFQQPLSRNSDLRTYAMMTLMEALSYPLEIQNGDIKTAGTILERDTTLRNLRQKARQAQQEQGTNILYLCFGFLTWRERSQGSATLRAPLLMMPVTLTRESTNSPYRLRRHDDEIVANPTLEHVLRNDYDIELPEFQFRDRDAHLLEDYLEAVRKVVEPQGWRVDSDVSLGLLSFSKISMYHDLEANRNRIMRNPMLRAFAGDATSLPEVPESLERYDFDKADPQDWHAVVDADSSQQEAILYSKQGLSFVLQGPPGTGKSQTITNIIAEAIADGKKVLFVSEKAAALQVVLNRLEEVHLSDFCLPLHSHKANRKEVVESIGKTLDLATAMGWGSANGRYTKGQIQRVLSRFTRSREELREYVDRLHEPIAPLNYSPYDAIRKLSERRNATRLVFEIPEIALISAATYNEMCECVDEIQRALRALGGKLNENPWRGAIVKMASETYREELLRKTEGLGDEVRDLASLAERIDGTLGTGMAHSLADLPAFTEAIDVLSACSGRIERQWLDADGAESARSQVDAARTHAESLRRTQISLERAWDPSIRSFDLMALRSLIREGQVRIPADRGDASAHDLVKGELERVKGLIGEVEGLLDAYREGSEFLALEQMGTPADMRMIAQVLATAAQSSGLQAHWFDGRRREAMAPHVREAITRAEAVKELRERILAEWEPDALEVDAGAMLARFRTEHQGVFHKFKSAYRSDIKTLRSFYRSVDGKLDEDKALEFLQVAKQVQDHRQWFADHARTLDEIAGRSIGVDAEEWNRLREEVAAAATIADQFPYATMDEGTVAACLEIGRSLQAAGRARRIADQISAGLDSLDQALVAGGLIDMAEEAFTIEGTILPRLRTVIQEYEMLDACIGTLDDAKREGPCTFAEIRQVLDDLDAIRDEEAYFDSNDEDLRASLGSGYRGLETDWDELARGLEFARRLWGAFEGQVPEAVVDAACNGGAVPAVAASDVANLRQLAASVEPKVAHFSDQFEGIDFRSMPMVDVAERYEACVRGFGQLALWIEYVEARERCRGVGLTSFVEAMERSDGRIPDLLEAFELRFFRLWLDRQLSSISVLRLFHRNRHEGDVAQFANLDVKQFGIAQDVIRAKVVDSFPVSTMRSRPDSELSKFQHERNKKRRLLPLRRLFSSIPELILTLKPCLMMSPLSVAYFLNADDYHFDMVIFDEASQVFPQDAIGAILRADQVIIAGDTQQLPPTNFFASSTNSAEEELADSDDDYEEVFDSILEEAASAIPDKRLLWHYRSRHESLISFSNQSMYDGKMVTFPSSVERERDAGVEFVYVEDGYYEPSPKQHNVREAQRIVELVEEHIRTHPKRSLGIIAFSEKQQQAIAREIQRFRETHPEFERFFAEDQPEEFFIKNIESVQGDERDTIFFSVGYAKTQEQKANGKPMNMRFGPLMNAGGERRLNVAITRAKKNVKLVSSITPEDIDPNRAKTEGPRMLRRYMEFARRGDVSLASKREPWLKDELVDEVAAFLEEKGYRIQRNVGNSSYKIDIAVCHPSDEVHSFVAGIECDGHFYRSAKTVRDRDRLRGSVLRGMGWSLYHIWSIEWQNNRESECRRLIDFIESAIESFDHKRTTTARDAAEQKRKVIEETVANPKASEMGSLVPSDLGLKDSAVPVLRAKGESVVQGAVRVPNVSTSSPAHKAAHMRKPASAGVFQPKLDHGKPVQAKAPGESSAGARSVHERAARPAPPSSRPVQPNPKSKSSMGSAKARSTGNLDIVDELERGGFEYVDNRSRSTILWVAYDPEKKEQFERIMKTRNITSYRLEMRASVAMGKAAWMIRCPS